jgi:hypothetical protein
MKLYNVYFKKIDINIYKYYLSILKNHADHADHADHKR